MDVYWALTGTGAVNMVHTDPMTYCLHWFGNI